jgi:hypothetical protein
MAGKAARRARAARGCVVFPAFSVRPALRSKRLADRSALLIVEVKFKLLSRPR